ncbi:nuclease-related domain-containing protein [Lactobacillaceae bacterium Melli_B4]
MALFSPDFFLIKVFNIFMIIVKLIIAGAIVDSFSSNTSGNNASDFNRDGYSNDDYQNGGYGNTNYQNNHNEHPNQRNANISLDDFSGGTQVKEDVKTEDHNEANGYQSTIYDDRKVVSKQNSYPDNSTRSKDKDVFVFNQGVQVKQHPKKLTVPNFLNRFITVPLGDTLYSKLLNIYRHYGPDHKNLFAWTVRQIQDTDKLLTRLAGTDIEYPIKGYEDFKNHFYNQVDDNGKKVSFFSFYNNQVNGDEGEQRIADDIEASSGIRPLKNINMPCLYLNNDNKTTHEGSTQIDVILVCQYGIFAFESKNYDADAISIEGNGKKDLVWDSIKQRPNKIDQQFIRTYKKGNTNDSDNSNMIGHQTFIHEQALIEYLDRDPNVSLDRNKLQYRTHSLFVYANANVDENGINKATGKQFYLGNNSHAEQLGWKVKGLPAAGCWDWVTTYNNNDSLDEAQINEVVESLKRYDRTTDENVYDHMIFNPSSDDNLAALDDYRSFLGHWYGYNKRIKAQLKSK